MTLSARIESKSRRVLSYAAMKENQVPTEAKGKLSPFESEVLKDFILSFHHSQGTYVVQEEIFAYLSTQYKTPDVSFNDLQSHLQDKIKKFWYPKIHVERISDPSEEYSNRWSQFSEAIGYNQYGLETKTKKMRSHLRNYERNPQAVMNSIAERICGVDSTYQRLGRPGRTSQEDRFESFIKTHTIDGKSTGSIGYDNIYQVIRSLIFDPPDYSGFEIFSEEMKHYQNFVYQLDDLINDWERNHPGKVFLEDSSMRFDPQEHVGE